MQIDNALLNHETSSLVIEYSFIDYVLDTGLVIDMKTEVTAREITFESLEVIVDRPLSLSLDIRVFLDESKKINVVLPIDEPIFEQRNNYVLIRRVQRRLVLNKYLEIAWQLFSKIDGRNSAKEILNGFSKDDLGSCRKLLALFIAEKVVCPSPQRIRRFIHQATKKGMLPGGDLNLGEILELVTDNIYREYPDSRRISMRSEVPQKLKALYSVIESRRSYRNYNGQPIHRSDFESILLCACGVTGKLNWQHNELRLRAYPSSGGLYAVEIYPIIFRVEGIQSGIYHYRAFQNELEIVQENIQQSQFIRVALPEEREMLSGVAAMFCLVSNFNRHEKKYGEGGYRMMIAEAGHISENIILVSTALGINARPFGGVFDDLLHASLGFKSQGEQFLLSVICGYCGSKNK